MLKHIFLCIFSRQAQTMQIKGPWGSDIKIAALNFQISTFLFHIMQKYSMRMFTGHVCWAHLHKFYWDGSESFSSVLSCVLHMRARWFDVNVVFLLIVKLREPKFWLTVPK